VRIVGISGSLRGGSYNRALLSAAQADLPAGVELREWRGLETLPAYNEDAEAEGPFAPAPVASLRRALAEGDAVLIATPEYNHSIPGALKNALDWASRPWPDNVLRGKPVAVVGASTGVFGALWAQAEARKILTAIGADVVDTTLPVASAGQAFTAEGRLRDAGAARALRAIVDELAQRTVRRAA
jgi:chromate reductase, NAD(P)H dehydrogenase (quinone)